MTKKKDPPPQARRIVTYECTADDLESEADALIPDSRPQSLQAVEAKMGEQKLSDSQAVQK